MQLNKLFKNPFTRSAKPVATQATKAKSSEGAALPSESVTLSESSEVSKPKSGRKSNFFNGGFAKTALAVGLVASMAMGMVGCTTMQTHCTPSHCVTTEVIDPVGTTLAIGAGIVIMDAVLEDAHINDGYYHHDHGHYEHHHEHGGYHDHGGYYYNY